MTRFYRFLQLLQKQEPDLKIQLKDQSAFMKFLGYLLFFNTKFITNYTTTIGKTIYLSSEKMPSIITLAHEFMHIRDTDKVKGPIFGFLYLLPQILAPFMLFFALVHWVLGAGLFLLFLLPLPAPMRAYYEIRGYTMSLFIRNEIYKEQGLNEQIRKDLLLDSANQYNKRFTSSAYYFMWPFGVKKQLKRKVDLIISEKILEDQIFQEVASAFRASRT